MKKLMMLIGTLMVISMVAGFLIGPLEVSAKTLVTPAVKPVLIMEANLTTIPITRPETGTLIMGEQSVDPNTGYLKIENGLESDAVVVITDTSAVPIPVMAVYIRGGDTYTIDHVGVGKFKVYFAVGDNWDMSTMKFTSNKRYKRFGEWFDFSNYWYQITLHPVPSGTAQTDYLQEDEFPVLK
jgi:hypothetical protein